MDQVEESKGMAAELKQVRNPVPVEKAEELPKSAAPEEVKEEAPVPVVEEKKEPVRLMGRDFESKEAALKYAEEMERERIEQDAYNQGIREALQAQQEAQAPVAEDNFEERFYSNPKETLKQVKEEAKREALAVIDAKNAEEAAWVEFAGENPDLADSRPEVMRILHENWDMLGKMKDRKRAKEILAGKTRAYFDEIIERRKPRRELSNKSGTAVSPGGAEPVSVTKGQKEARPLTFSEQLRTMRKRT